MSTAGVCEEKPRAGQRPCHSESPLTQAIERHAANLPSDAFLWAAFGSIGLSLTMWMMGRQHAASFLGQWAPTFLILGVYSKITKEGGHERER